MTARTNAQTFEEMAARVRIESVRRDPTDDERKENRNGIDTGARYWTVTLRYANRRMTTPYHAGSGHKDDPKAADVLSCLISDGESVANAGSFEDWCGECGYDEDSRTAERTYKACAELGARVVLLLGADYPKFRDAAQDY